MARFIPATMATQHPDNAFKSYWSAHPFVSTPEEVEECYRSFADLGCDEYMWDWEGKFVDEAVVDRLYLQYLNYFSKNPLGLKKFLTFRVPNIAREGQARLARAFAGILSASYTALDLKLPSPPLFEVIHPMTQSAEELVVLQKKFYETARFQKKILNLKNLKPEHLDIIPLIEGTGTLLKSRSILEKYTRFMERFTGSRPKIIRPFIARSDPALDGGFLAAVLSAKAALSEYYRFEEVTGVAVKPIIGVGSLRFRGGLNPFTVDEFLKTYPGVRTVTLQSSFRYDYRLSDVKSAIAQLNRRLGNTEAKIYSEKQMKQIGELDGILVKHYRSTVEGLAPFINPMASHIPSRRERIQHTGHFGYSRNLGRKKLQLPRAISYTAVFYSVGIPPEFIGLGRALNEARRARLWGIVENSVPNLKEQLLQVGRYFNRENLKILTQRLTPFKLIEKDIQILEDYLGQKLEPAKPDEIMHRNYTSNVIQNWIKGSSLEEDILKAAQMRRSLG